MSVATGHWGQCSRKTDWDFWSCDSLHNNLSRVSASKPNVTGARKASKYKAKEACSNVQQASSLTCATVAAMPNSILWSFLLNSMLSFTGSTGWAMLELATFNTRISRQLLYNRNHILVQLKSFFAWSIGQLRVKCMNPALVSYKCNRSSLSLRTSWTVRILKGVWMYCTQT